MSTPTRYRQFLAIVEHGSYRRAALALRVSQPALSKSIQALEAELGVRLFDRQSRTVSLTAFGQRVLDYARQMVGAAEDLRHDLAQLAGLSSGHVDVALGPYPSVISGYAAAARLLRQHPQLSLALRVASWRMVMQTVAARQADLGVAELSDAPAQPMLQTEVVGRHRAQFFCRVGHPILQRRKATLEDLLRHPWATTRLPPRIARTFPGDLGRAGRRDESTGDIVPAVELDVPMQLAALAGSGDVLVLGPFASMEQELAAGRVLPVPSTTAAFVSEYGFLWLAHRSLSPAAQAFMQAVREAERDFAQREARLAARYAPK